MRTGMIGLGRMGMNMSRRLLKGGHGTVVYNRTADKVNLMVSEGAEGAFSLKELVSKLAPPRIIWMMLPAGGITDSHLKQLSVLLSPGDIIIDGGNSYYKDAVRRAGELGLSGIGFIDAGVSGGIWGLEKGYCVMTGGSESACGKIEPLLKTLCAEGGYLRCGASGAGHFVKMVHNGIEYAMMEAYGEGFEMLKNSPYSGHLDMEKTARLWNNGSVVRSWLLELIASALEKDPGLSSIAPYVEDSGEGRWTVQQAVDSGVPVPAIAAALFKRFRSRQEDAFSDRVIAALRREFGGHRVFVKND